MVEVNSQSKMDNTNVGVHVPIVSIGMPVYNGAKYICEALDSLLAQTFSDFELIISDNASKDDTAAICRAYSLKDPRIQVVSQPMNQGALANFQYVLDQSRGAFFMWAAADDKWDANWIERLYNRIKDESGAAGFGRLIHIDAHSAALDHAANDAALTFTGGPLKRKLAFYLSYEGLGKANLFYALYPRAILQKIDLRSHRIDYQILFGLVEHLTYIQVSEPRLFKRIHGESDGVSGASIWRSPAVFAPFRLLRSDWRIASHYFQCVGPGLRAVLLILLPLKLLASVRFRLVRGVSLLVNRLRST